MRKKSRESSEIGGVMEKCANCGRKIGELETPHLWRERVVCGQCVAIVRRAELDYASPPAAEQPPPLGVPLGSSSNLFTQTVLGQTLRGASSTGDLLRTVVAAALVLAGIGMVFYGGADLFKALTMSPPRAGGDEFAQLREAMMGVSQTIVFNRGAVNSSLGLLLIGVAALASGKR
jgi:hypothetical protein